MASTARKLNKTKSTIARHMPKTLREVKNRRPSKEIAVERIYEFLYEIGAEYDYELGWRIRAIERAGLNESTGYAILRQEKETVTSDVVDQVSMATGVPCGIFYDEDV